MSAVISECAQYRFRLDRQVAPLRITKPVLFIGINPSTADAEENDATIRKMIGFTSRWGYSDLMVGNIFPYRATDVRELASIPHGTGTGALTNRDHLNAMIDECAFIVPCWGNANKVPGHLRPYIHMVRTMIRLSQKPVRIFGLTRSGDPMHPLMLPYSTTLKEWLAL